MKKTIFSILTPAVKWVPTGVIIKVRADKLLLPMYHAVNDQHVKHLQNLYTVKRSAEFISELDYLLKYFQPIGLKELIEHVIQNKKFRKPVFHLTFDDGLSEFNNVIAPVLLSKGIPATCFLNSAFLDNKELFYRYQAGLLIEELHNSPVGSSNWKSFHEWCKTNNFPSVYYKKILKSVSYENKNLLDDLALATGVNFKEYLLKEKPYLDADMVRKLILQGFTFGAHSIDHPEYRYLSEEEQIRQTKESMDYICNLFQLDYRVFSFPFTDSGVKKSFFDTIFNEKIADLTFGCAGIKDDLIQRNLQRIPVENYAIPFKETLKKETVYYLITRLINKHKLRRK
jgi:peptidoglycan/xylan/chitin deacetylase (PgdA/CDA1 family)